MNNLKIIDDPDNVDRRMQRGKTQKIYLVNRNVDDSTATFNVMGTTGNIYEVKLSGSPTCSCPDFCQRRNRCKHIFFMLAKIFAIKNPYQATFSKAEIENYIKSYKDNILKFSIKYDVKLNCTDVGPKCIEDDCCICLDPILNGDPYVYCKKTCGRCVHTDCYNMVIKKTSKCPYCQNNFKC